MKEMFYLTTHLTHLCTFIWRRTTNSIVPSNTSTVKKIFKISYNNLVVVCFFFFFFVVFLVVVLFVCFYFSFVVFYLL